MDLLRVAWASIGQASDTDKPFAVQTIQGSSRSKNKTRLAPRLLSCIVCLNLAAKYCNTCRIQPGVWSCGCG